MSTGFVLGKFAPFHKGHQLLIETSIQENDRTIVLIYDEPTLINTPLYVRANWIRSIYPNVEVIAGYNSPNDTGYTDDIMRKQEEYISSLGIHNITNFYSSEPYGEHISKYLGCNDRRVDMSRLNIPISATEIRSNPFKYKNFLHPIVYNSLVKKICFMGAPSTGKSTLSTALAKKFNTTVMDEYGREYWENKQVDRRLTPEELLEIATGHIERENVKVNEANKFCFIDTNAATTYLFSLYYHGYKNTNIILRELAEQCFSRYDKIIVCHNDIPYEDTWDRSGDVNRAMFQRMNIDYLNYKKIPYQLVYGNLDHRIELVTKLIGE